MIVYLLSSGLACLQAQAADPSHKITLTSFALAETADFEYSPGMSAPVGHVFYSGTPTDMAWTRLSNNEICISMKVGYNKPYGLIGNVMLFVTFNGTVYPFLLMRLDDASRINHHLNDVDNDAGMDLFLRVIFRLTNVFNRFDLTGVTQEVASWYHAIEEVPDPQGQESDQIVVENHISAGGRPVLATNVTNEWWGSPFDKPLIDDPSLNVVSGGEAGDNYVYTP